MANMKHVGRVKNTGNKCIVMFREMYDERGNVIDPNHCLVIETDRLPDMEHDDVVRVVESPAGQEASQFYEIAHRSMFADGRNMLVGLTQAGYLRKYATEQIELTPNSSTAVLLSEVNAVIRGDVNEDGTIPDTAPAPSGDEALSDEDIAKGLLAQADTMEAEAKRLREEAYTTAPSLKPKRKTTAKKTTTKKTTTKKAAA